ncbi:hypothetical protein K9M59_01265 [Candidatus Gracilibacteria bacterium]|nr:hypothetical protein [Candidatus Gracilibacteria bacterium]MCF7819197.1 hypothetical protein [Candidatus Gracilibacteria bacterium]
MFLKTKSRGESIAEILVSTAILVIILTSVFGLISQGMKTTINIENRVRAINIAREGIEAVRNIRDTNWLQYSGDRRNKWLCAETVDLSGEPNILQSHCNTGGGAGNIVDGFYRVHFSPTFKRYFLEEIFGAVELDLSDNLIDFSNFRLYENSDEFRLTYESDDNSPTPFYRQLELIPSSTNVCPGGSCPEEKLRVISRVQWQENRTVREVILESHLFDFYARDEY